MPNKIDQDAEFNYLVNIIILALVFLYLGADVYGKYISDERKAYTSRGFNYLEQVIAPKKENKTLKQNNDNKQLIYIPQYNAFVFSK